MGKAFGILGRNFPEWLLRMLWLAKSRKKAKILGGYDEEWCDEEGVERFKCAICLLVARSAMAHKCGSVLFCKGYLAA